MILHLHYVLILVLVSNTASSDYSLKGDPCSKFDTCAGQPELRSCSCEDDCEFYGTCCQDFQNQEDLKMSPYSCYSRRTVSPIFAKRSCSDDYKGHIDDKLACHDDDEDIMDVKNNLLVTSHKTKITYWNKHCAKCSHELREDLEFWNILVYCPKVKNVDRYLIRRNLTFDQEKEKWGLEMDGEFLPCIVTYFPPTYISEVKRCSSKLISSCPSNYTNEEIVTFCTKYYAERKLKGTDLHYKNIHCAICNGVDVTNLECSSMTIPKGKAAEIDTRLVITEMFTSGTWIEKEPSKSFECSEGFAYDPVRTKCRRDPSLSKIAELAPNSSYICRQSNLLVFALLCVFMFILKKDA